MPAISIEPARADSPEARTLIEELDTYLLPLYPIASHHGYDVEKMLAQKVDFFILRSDGELASCGGLQIYAGSNAANDYGEIKRMYTRPQFRGQGLAQRMLDHLIAFARTHGLKLLRLETGYLQHSAIRLYERTGFTPIAHFGEYEEDPLSRFFEKKLD
jgi:putative acetyltransferase